MLLDDLKSLLTTHHLWAKKALGQNFLINEGVFEQILGAADLKPDDFVVEVGPGTGFLTERLLPKVSHLIAVEYDPDMVKVLRKRFKDENKLELLQSDILRFRIETFVPKNQPYKVVANIPYYITSPLLQHFLQCPHRPTELVLLIQREVAEKIVGDKDAGVITVQTQLFGKPEIIGIVPARSFYPAPKVESAILKITVYPEPLISEADYNDFMRLVKFGFSGKRKKLSNSLAAGLHLEAEQTRQILAAAQISPDLRAENLSIDDWKRLFQVVGK